MDEKILKDLLSRRLYLELQLFRYYTLQQTKEDIYRASYKIEVFINTYDILMDELDTMEKETLCILLYQEKSILELLYERWLLQEGSILDGLESCVCSELEAIAELYHSGCRKGEKDGTGFDQAA